MERLSDYDYDLPARLIAQEPLADRADARLLVLDRRSGAMEHRTFRECMTYLQPGDLLVLNNTRVSARRMHGLKSTGGAVELLLLRPTGTDCYEALAKPAKRLHMGARVSFLRGLECEVVGIGAAGMRQLRFNGPIEGTGEVPLPPYIHSSIADPERYQTVYSAQDGSAAAPTAGLHFTEELLRKIEAKGVKLAWVSLDVGLDTFRPVQAERVKDHVMHGERCTVPNATAKAIAECRGRIFAVGTTTVRTLESFAKGKRKVDSGTLSTKLFIHEGYDYKIVDAMFTNFHLPRTSMLMMISALAGREHIFNAYREAIHLGYRFLSFGDSMLIV